MHTPITVTSATLRTHGCTPIEDRIAAGENVYESRTTVTATELRTIAAAKKAPRRISWTTTEPTVIPAGQKLVSVSDGTVRYYATVPQKSTVLGIGRAFARGFDHGESTGEVTATIERRFGRTSGFVRAAVRWEMLGCVKFGPSLPVMLA